MELRERGWSIRAAAKEVGVARTTGTNWACGHKVYRNGQVVGSSLRWSACPYVRSVRDSFPRTNGLRSRTCATLV
ncbi:hypothetical protein [Nocardioides sp.]